VLYGVVPIDDWGSLTIIALVQAAHPLGAITDGDLLPGLGQMLAAGLGPLERFESLDIA
jgi:hypothetical protein